MKIFAVYRSNRGYIIEFVDDKNVHELHTINTVGLTCVYESSDNDEAYKHNSITKINDAIIGVTILSHVGIDDNYRFDFETGLHLTFQKLNGKVSVFDSNGTYYDSIYCVSNKDKFFKIYSEPFYFITTVNNCSITHPHIYQNCAKSLFVSHRYLDEIVKLLTQRYGTKPKIELICLRNQDL